MLTFQDFADYCDLSDEEIRSILNGASVTDMESCAIIAEKIDPKLQCRKKDEFLQLYLQKAENTSNKNRTH